HAVAALGPGRAARDEGRRGPRPADLPRRVPGVRRGARRRRVPAEPLPRRLPRGDEEGGPGGRWGLLLMLPHSLRAPSADGALLAEPPLARGGGMLAANAERLALWDHDFQGRRASWLRPAVRRQVLDRARSFLRDAG